MTMNRTSAPLQLDRREALLSSLGFLLLFSACRSSGEPRAETMEEVLESLRSRLTALAESPEDEQQLLSLLAEVQAASTELVDNHVTFVEEADRLSRDYAVGADTLKAQLEAGLELRGQAARRLLVLQDRIRSQLGPDRWSKLVDDLNNPDRMERIVGRKS